MKRDSASPLSFIKQMQQHRSLLLQMIQRDITSRYRGSALGLVWSFITPLLMLAVYSFMFGVVFNARFGDAASSDMDANFTLTLFCGLVIHTLLSDCLTRAPTIILHHSSYVKKVVFPLEILPAMVVGSALFHFAMGVMVLAGGLLLANHTLPLTILYLPIVILPFLPLLLGISYLLAALGVYLRDIGQLTGLVSTMLLFLSPIFYPIEALPEAFRPLMFANPLTPIIQQMRAIAIGGLAPDFMMLGAYLALSLCILFVGYGWFQVTRKGFADIM